MKTARIKGIRKILSPMLVSALVAANLTGLVPGTNIAKANPSFTAPQAVIDHLNQDDWSNLQGILSGIYGMVTSPLKISDLNKGGYTTGQLMGNGDIGAIAAGVSTTSQQFYFGKNDFWGTLHAQGSSIKDNQGILSGGGLYIGSTTAAGSAASSTFNMKQDIINAQVTTTMQVKNNEGYDATIQMNSWTADTDNVFVSEITNTGNGAVTLNAKQWVPASAYASASATDLTDANSTYPYTGGIDTSGTNPVLWTTRDSNAGVNGNTSNFRSRMGTATTVVGAALTNTAEKIEAKDYYDSNKGKYYNSLGESGDFTVEANETVYVVTYFASSSGTYNAIKSVTGVQQDAVAGISAYTSKSDIDQLKTDHLNWWKDYYLKSYVQFNDFALNQYYYSSLYILGSSSRPTSANGKVNPQNLPGSMYGEWIPADNMGWGGRYFLNYNQQAHYYASGTTNRMETAVPYNRVISYELPWNHNIAAGQGFDGATHVRTLSPFHLMASNQPNLSTKAGTKSYGFSVSSTDQKSNGMFASILMIAYYQYTLDDEYLKNVLYPHLKDLLTFYDSYVLKTDDGNGQYHYSVIGSSIHEGDAADITPDLDVGAIKFMSGFLIDHGSEMSESQANLDRWQDLADHTFYPEAMLPKGIFNAAKNSNFVPTLLATDYQSPNQAHVDMIEPGDQPVELEGVVFPFENVQLLDGDKELLQKVNNTIEYMNSWAAAGFAGWSSQNNGFPKVYPIVARAGWPAADLLSKFKTALSAKLRTSNLSYYGSGGAVETVGAMEGLNSMLMQSNTTTKVPSTIMAFPNWDKSKSVTFERLGAKGNVEVSSTFDANTQTIPYVDLFSKRAGKIALVNPWTTGMPVIQIVNPDKTLGAAVNYAINGGKLIFDAAKDTRYMVMNDTTDLTNHVSEITFDKYSTTLIYNGTGGTDTGAVTATIAGNPDDTLTWTSSDSSIVTVSGNSNTATIKAVGTGTNKVANVTVTAKSSQDAGVTQTLKVKVADVSTVPTGLTMINPTTATIYGPNTTASDMGKVTGTNRLQLTAYVQPSNAYDKRIMWTSSNQNVAMVDKNGLVIARGSGTVTITGKSMVNPSVPSIAVTVNVVAASGADNSGDANLAAVLTAAKSISAYTGDKTSGGGFVKKTNSPNWEGMQESFQRAQINALGVKAKYSGYSTTNISKDTAYFAAIALNEAIRAIDPSKALNLSTIDKTALAAAINTASQYTADNFDSTQDWADLQTALATANEVNISLVATQDDVTNALAVLQVAMSKVTKIPVQTISLAQIGKGISSTGTKPSGNMAYPLGAVGLDLNPSTTILPASTNKTTLAATTVPATATDKSITWTVTDLIGTNVVTLGTPQTGNAAILTMLTDNTNAQGTKSQQFDSTVSVVAANAGVAIVTATNTASGISAKYIVTVSDQTTTYAEAEPGGNTNAIYTNGGTDKAASGSTSSGGKLAGSLTNTKPLQITTNVASSGDYNIVVYYATTTARNGTVQRGLSISVNGGNAYKFITQGISYNYDFPEVVPIMVTVPLNAGNNIIKLVGDTSLTSNTNAPNIDKIGIAPISSNNYTAVASNVIAVTAASTTVNAVVAANLTTNLNKVKDGVTYQIYRDGIAVGDPVPVSMYVPTKEAYGPTYEYDAIGEGIMPAGTGLVLRNYTAIFDKLNYPAAGTYTVKFSANDGTTSYTSDEVKLFTKGLTATRFTITSSAGTNGTIDPSGSVFVNEDEDQTFVFTPANGYVIDKLTVDDMNVAVDGTEYTFINVNENHSINVTFKRHTILASAGENGSISPSGMVPVNDSADQVFTFDPDEGYAIDTVKVDGTDVTASGSYTFTKVIKNHTIEVTFKAIPPNTHTITASAGTHGSISPDGIILVNEGTDKTITFTPDNGYEIDTVNVDGTDVTVSGSYTFENVTKDHAIIVTFKLIPPNTHTITASAGTNGSISPNGSVVVTEGTNKTFTFTSDNGYTIDKVNVDGTDVTVSGSYTFTNIVGNHTINITFKAIPPNTHTISASAGTNGSISPDGIVLVNEGTDKTFTFTSDNGYTIDKVNVDGTDVTVSGSYTFTNVVGNHSINVTFKAIPPNTHTITASAGTNGSISPTGSVVVTEGTNKSFTFTSDNGYTIDKVNVDGTDVTVSGSYTFTNVVGNHSINVTFKAITPNTHTITASAGTNGSISPNGSIVVNEGTNKTFTFTPDSGYAIDKVKIDGTEITVNGSYTFTNVTHNHTIIVTFKQSGGVDNGNNDNNGNNGNNQKYVVKSEDITKSAANGKVTVSVTGDKETIVMPYNTTELLGQNQLVIQTEKLTLDIPTELLRQLTGKVSSEALKDSRIELKVTPLSEPDAKELLAKGDSSKQIKLSGEVYDFSLSIVTKDGVTSNITKFDKPITIRLKVDPTLNPKWVGIYYISDNGTLEFIGGQYVNGEMVAQISHFSKYAVLEVTKSFADVPASHWAANVIKELASKDILNGTSATKFEPGRNVTRAEFTAMLVRALKLTEKAELKFTDVKTNDWYAEAISIAVKAGIVKGKNDTLFNPNGQITREEMVTMLMRAYEVVNGKSALNAGISFKDESKVSPWALEYVQAAAGLQLIKGRSEGKFEPQGITNRAEAAQVIYNLLNK
ncbi:hypothetical protein D7Z26_10570 [Cohnella endophytica]|uniref:Uncharacterized protein n=1 Tax=Cohnella endophytica TaxID=2419778 RepID=A0A494XVW7_9BACL|nr:S-layer homology domain-containing protein [Cohnella endophytica]RKP53834.1 hypothetical protein D7Z26_10570 [Cohnella endophytica]